MIVMAQSQPRQPDTEAEVDLAIVSIGTWCFYIHPSAIRGDDEQSKQKSLDAIKNNLKNVAGDVRYAIAETGSHRFCLFNLNIDYKDLPNFRKKLIDALDAGAEIWGSFPDHVYVSYYSRGRFLTRNLYTFPETDEAARNIMSVTNKLYFEIKQHIGKPLIQQPTTQPQKPTTPATTTKPTTTTTPPTSPTPTTRPQPQSRPRPKPRPQPQKPTTPTSTTTTPTTQPQKRPQTRPQPQPQPRPQPQRQIQQPSPQIQPQQPQQQREPEGFFRRLFRRQKPPPPTQPQPQPQTQPTHRPSDEYPMYGEEDIPPELYDKIKALGDLTVKYISLMDQDLSLMDAIEKEIDNKRGALYSGKLMEYLVWLQKAKNHIESNESKNSVELIAHVLATYGKDLHPALIQIFENYIDIVEFYDDKVNNLINKIHSTRPIFYNEQDIKERPSLNDILNLAQYVQEHLNSLQEELASMNEIDKALDSGYLRGAQVMEYFDWLQGAKESIEHRHQKENNNFVSDILATYGSNLPKKVYLLFENYLDTVRLYEDKVNKLIRKINDRTKPSYEQKQVKKVPIEHKMSFSINPTTEGAPTSYEPW